MGANLKRYCPWTPSSVPIIVEMASQDLHDKQDITVFFGGTFDPPHLGHRHCAERVLDVLPKARIVVVPSPVPPQSAATIKSPVASYEHRLQMCRLVFAGLSRVEVSDLEAPLPPPHYTYRSLEVLQKTVNGPIALMIGQDQILNLPSWRHPEKVVSIAQLIVVARPSFRSHGSDKNDSTQETLTHLTPLTFDKIASIITAISTQSAKQVERPGPKALVPQPIILDQSSHSASSTLIRQSLFAGTPVPPEWLSEDELQYIKANHLYGAT